MPRWRLYCKGIVISGSNPEMTLAIALRMPIHPIPLAMPTPSWRGRLIPFAGPPSCPPGRTAA
jgi:hypothetical protein